MVRAVLKHGQQSEFAENLFEVRSSIAKRVITGNVNVTSAHLYE